MSKFPGKWKIDPQIADGNFKVLCKLAQPYLFNLVFCFFLIGPSSQGLLPLTSCVYADVVLFIHPST